MKVWSFALLFLWPALALAQDLQIRDIEMGEGPPAAQHDTVTVHYTGWLEDGTVFDSSHDRNQPFELTLGAGQVIAGWEQGLEGMRVGGVRELIIPPELGYGSRGAGGVIPPDATLRFEVELLEIQGASFGHLDNAGLAEKLAENVTVIDIRRAEEWAQTGVVAGSHRITAFDADGRFRPEFGAELLATVQPGEPVVLICRVGNRTGVLAQALVEQAGFEEVYHAEAGIMGWLAESRPVRSDCPSREANPVC